MKPIPPFPHNKRILFFDTETSDLNPRVSEILQLSYIIVDGSTWNVLKETNFYFAYPEEEWCVSPKAIEVNHLTKEFLSKQKLTLRHEALTIFFTDLYTCQLAVAHNISFDCAHIEETACREKVLRHNWPLTYCTMLGTTNICQIPFSNGGMGYKWPKLEELANYLHVTFSQTSLHDSLADTRLTLECFKQLHANGQLDLYVYHNYLTLDSPIENAKELFPHQDATSYLGSDAPNIIIHDEILSTYNFVRKLVAYTIPEEMVGKTHIRAILQKAGGFWTSSFISQSGIIADALIISHDITPSNRHIFQQVADYQQTHPDFPVFTLEAFRHRPETDDYEEEMKMFVEMRRYERNIRIEELRKKYKIEEQDRTGKDDKVIDGRYYRNGHLFEFCDQPEVNNSEEARLITTPIGKTIIFDISYFKKHGKWILEVGDYVRFRATPGTRTSLSILFKEKVLWKGDDKYIRRFMSVGKDKIARVIKVEDEKEYRLIRNKNGNETRIYDNVYKWGGVYGKKGIRTTI